MLAADLVIDPLAAGPLHYWRWQTNGLYYGVPLTNFAGWLAVSVLIVLITPRSTARLNAIPATVVAFFSILAARYALWLPAAIGLCPYFCSCSSFVSTFGNDIFNPSRVSIIT